MRTPSRPSGLIGGGSSFVRNEQRFIRSEKSGSKTITAARLSARDEPLGLGAVGNDFQANVLRRGEVVDHHLRPRLLGKRLLRLQPRVEVHDRDAEPLVRLLAEALARAHSPSTRMSNSGVTSRITALRASRSSRRRSFAARVRMGMR